MNLTEGRSSHIFTNTTLKLNKKLDTLTRQNQINISIKKQNWVLNLRDVHLPEVVVNTVALGSKYNITSRLNQPDVILTIKNLENKLTNAKIESDIKNEIRENISNIIKNNRNRDTHIALEDREFTKNLTLTKRFLHENPQIFFTHADKGNLTVCFNLTDYQKKMKVLLNDNNTYKVIKKNPLKRLQSEVYKHIAFKQ